MKRIGLMTGGGDCSGLNAAIRAVVRRGMQLGYEIVGIRRGYEGLVEKDVFVFDDKAVSNILSRGGTILRSSRTTPHTVSEEGLKAIIATAKELSLLGLIIIGGDGTLNVARQLSAKGLPIIGIPKTIDNDLNGTDYTIGFDTALTIATEAIDRLHSTAESHDRVMVIELMGRYAGWIAAMAGIGGGADIIVLPERPVKMSRICEFLTRRHTVRGKNFSIVAVAEGANILDEASGQPIKFTEDTDMFGNPKVGDVSGYVTKKIKELTGFDTRLTILGHLQRGGTPSPFDRILATRMGVAAVEYFDSGEFGMMTAYRGYRIQPVPLEIAVGKIKTVPDHLIDTAEVFFG